MADTARCLLNIHSPLHAYYLNPNNFYSMGIRPIKNKHLPRLPCRYVHMWHSSGQWVVSQRDGLSWQSPFHLFPPLPLLLPDWSYDSWKFRSLLVSERTTCQGWRTRKRKVAWGVDSIIEPLSCSGGLTYDPSGKEKKYLFFSEATLSLVSVICSQSNYNWYPIPALLVGLASEGCMYARLCSTSSSSEPQFTYWLLFHM